MPAITCDGWGIPAKNRQYDAGTVKRAQHDAGTLVLTPLVHCRLLRVAQGFQRNSYGPRPEAVPATDRGACEADVKPL